MDRVHSDRKPAAARSLAAVYANQTLNASAFSSNESLLELFDASLLAASATRFVCVATNTYNNRTNTATLNVTVNVTLVIEPQGPLSSQTPERSTPAFGLLFEAKVSVATPLLEPLSTVSTPAVGPPFNYVPLAAAGALVLILMLTVVAVLIFRYCV